MARRSGLSESTIGRIWRDFGLKPHIQDSFKLSTVLKFLKKIDKNVPDELDVHLVCDNYATHKTPEIRAWLGPPPALPRPLHPDRLVLAEPDPR